MLQLYIVLGYIVGDNSSRLCFNILKCETIVKPDVPVRFRDKNQLVNILVLVGTDTAGN